MKYFTLLTLLTFIAATASADWPTWHGPGGNFSVPGEGLEIVDDPNEIRKVWESEYDDIGAGKFGLRPASAYAKLEHDKKHQGGYASPIVADGMVYVIHYRPSGKVMAEGLPKRFTESLPAESLTIEADDVIVAIDAETGKTRWVSSQGGKGMNYFMDKRGGWGVTPCYHESTVFAVGTTGRLYALDGETGELKWESNIGPAHEEFEAQKAEALKTRKPAGRTGSWKSSPVVAEGVLIVPDYTGQTQGLRGISTEDGKLLWHTEDVITDRATPSLVNFEDRTYLLTGTGEGEMNLIDPRDGNILWTLDGLGPNNRTLMPEDGYVLVNIKPTPDREKIKGQFGCYKLSLKGAELVWSLPDEPKYAFEWWPDAGAHRIMVIGNGVAHLFLTERVDKTSPRNNGWVRVELATGKVIDHRRNMERRPIMPYMIEDKIIFFGDLNHHPDWGQWFIAPADLPLETPIAEPAPFRHQLTSGYETQLEFPVVNGRMFMRTLDGRIACYDLTREVQK